MKIVIPSYQRAGHVRTMETLAGAAWVACHEFEADEYRKHYQQVMAVPDERRGNIAKVRNWILDHAEDERIVMMDDDVWEVGFFEGERMRVDNCLAPGEILRLLGRGYALAEDLGVTLWGINLQWDRRFYRRYAPFSMKSVVLGPFSCHLRPRLRYDERLSLNEDYDFFLQTMRENHKILRMNKYYYMAGYIDERGGCSVYRTLEREYEQAKLMQRKWGSRVVKYDFKKPTNPVVHVPIPGI